MTFDKFRYCRRGIASGFATTADAVKNRCAGNATGAGAALPRIRSEPFSAITMVAVGVGAHVRTRERLAVHKP